MFYKFKTETEMKISSKLTDLIGNAQLLEFTDFNRLNSVSGRLILTMPDTMSVERRNLLKALGAGFVPNVLNTSIIDEIYKVRNEEAFETSQALAWTEGLLVGILSGAAAFAAMQIAKRPEYKGKIVVAVLPDTGERYLSTALYESLGTAAEVRHDRGSPPARK
jgi:hypothetical protein